MATIQLNRLQIISSITTSDVAASCNFDGLGAEKTDFNRSCYNIWTGNAVDK